MAWQVDPYHLQVEFAVKHFGMMTVRGHFGEVTASGQLDPQNPAASSVEVTIKTDSIKTNNPQRDLDLRSSNFLEIDKYPTITFKITRYGEINDERMGHRVAYSAEGEINRKDFGLTMNMLVDGRFVVGDEVKIAIELELVEQKQPAT